MTEHIEKLETGIPGFDAIADGGLPRGRTTLVAGSAGSAKTILAMQFLAEGIRRGEAGVFVTFEESPDDIRRNVVSLGWDLEDWEAQDQMAFVDVSPQPDFEELVAGDYDLGGLIARIEHAIRQVGASRVAVDSLGAVFAHYEESRSVRQELRRLATGLRQLGVTSVLTAERQDEYGPISRFGVEEFVADNVVILRNALEEEKRRRTMEILKFRGTEHQKGEYPFTIVDGVGVTAVPLSSLELKQPSSNVRANSGVPELDAMLGGGFFRDSIILISGATGTGKTLTAMHFIEGGLRAGEKVLLMGFEESRAQLFRNAIGWGFDLEEYEKSGQLKVECVYPETQSLEDHLVSIRETIDEFGPGRIAVDSLSALERVGSVRAFREFVLGLTSSIKHHEMSGLFTNTSRDLLASRTTTNAHISTITDTIVLLRYVEVNGAMRRGLTVLKMRGSMHDKAIREFTIDHGGMHIGDAFQNISGIISGRTHQIVPDEIGRLSGMFEEAGEIVEEDLDEAADG